MFWIILHNNTLGIYWCFENFILYIPLDIKKLIVDEGIFKDSCESFVGSVIVNRVIVCFIHLVISTLFADNKYRLTSVIFIQESYE